MDRYTTDLKGTGLLFLSLKPRLLKCTMPSMASNKNREIGAQLKDCLSVELLEDNGDENWNRALGRIDLLK